MGRFEIDGYGKAGANRTILLNVYIWGLYSTSGHLGMDDTWPVWMFLVFGLNTGASTCNRHMRNTLGIRDPRSDGEF